MEFRLLGPVRALAGGEAVALGAPKQRALLAELLLHAGEVVPLDHLIDALWDEEPPASAQGTLQVYVHGLRRALGAERIERAGDGYRIRIERGELDLEELERLLRRAETSLAAGRAAAAEEDAARALALWEGPPLADLARQPVARTAAPRLEELRLRALELRTDARLVLGEAAALVADLEAVAAEQPYRERPVEQLALALYRAGRQTDALEAIRAARRRLLDDLGVEPGPGLQELETAILRHDPGLRPPGAAQPGPKPGLPRPPTPLVGRRLEAAAIEALLRREECRLVTLTGPGGTGKTRLALAAAAALEPELGDGAAFVDLSQVRDGGLVLPTVGRALGLGEENVPAAIGDRALLLLLDNLEQLGDAVAPVADLLAACPRLRVLATSRSPLRLQGEHEYPVPPLPVPGVEQPAGALAANEAVQLFAARARAVDPAFELDEATLPHVGAICRRLDGLPLALELAAARVRSLPVTELAPRLARALELLVEGARDLPSRQRTLRATLDWSLELLPDDGRELLARLGVLAGGATLADLEAVVGRDAARELGRLVEASLVRRRGARYLLLETIREYALEQLRGFGLEEELRDAHARHYLERARWADECLSTGTPEEAEAFAFFEAEGDNLWAALDWASAAGELELEVGLAKALRWFWHIRGGLQEGRIVFERLEASTRGAAPELRAGALAYGGIFPNRLGDTERAKRWFSEALELYRRLEDADGISRAIGELGAVALAEADWERAEDLFLEAIPLYERIGRRSRVATALGNLEIAALGRGDLDAALEYGDRAVALHRELNFTDGLAVSLYNLADLHLRRDEPDRADEVLRETFASAAAVGYREVTAYALTAWARLSLGRGDAEAAARALGAGLELFERLGITLTGEEARLVDDALEGARAALGPDRAAALAAEGAAAAPGELVEALLRLN